jgi:F-type H+-transporting ATPase subunit b
MDKLVNDFSIRIVLLAVVYFHRACFPVEEIRLKPILTAVNEREEGIRSALLSAENAKKEMQNLQADNQRILQEARMSATRCLKKPVK